MVDVPPADGAGAQAVPPTSRHSFPVVRLAYALGFALVAWFVFWLALLMGLLQFVVFAFDGNANDEIKDFSSRLVQYLWELLGFVTFFRDETPFPIGPFPLGMLSPIEVQKLSPRHSR